MMKKEKIFGEKYFEEGVGYPGYSIKRWNNYFLHLANYLKSKYQPQRILDVGCAKGFLVNSFYESGIEAFGVDISPYAISQSPREVGNRIYCLDIEEDTFPFEDNYFELVCVLETIEHLNYFDNLLKELKRVLKSGGVVFISTPLSRTSIVEKDLKIFIYGTIYKIIFHNIPDPDITHVNVHDREYWINLFEKYGFKIDTTNSPKLSDLIPNELEFIRAEREALKYAPSSKRFAIFLKFGKIGDYMLRTLGALFRYFYIATLVREGNYLAFINKK